MKDTKEQVSDKEEYRKQYHPAMCRAVRLTLYDDRDLLEFDEKVSLNTLPREIDFMVLRKEKPGVIRNELGRIFRRCNIFEFKGYGDKLNVNVFNKTMSYAFEYLSMHGELGGIGDVTLTFLREGKPRELMKWLMVEGCEKQSSPPWVFRYTRSGWPDIQIVDIAHPDVPIVLKILSHKAERDDIIKAVRYINGMPDKEKEEAKLVMELSYRINGDQRGGLEMGGFFEAYVDPLQEIIKKQSEELEQKDAALEEKDEVIEQKDEALEQKDAELEQYREELARKDEIIAKLMKQGAVLN